MIKFKSLNKSSQFLSILKKRKLDTKYFTLFFDKNNSDKKNNKILNISFVMKKKIGNAVIRYAVQKILNNKQIDMNCTYVIFGKNNVYKDKFDLVLNEMNNTLLKVKKINN